MKEAIKITPKNLNAALVLSILAQRELAYGNGKRDSFAVFVRGSAGTAKSATIKALPDLLQPLTGKEWGYAGINLANTMPEEFRGLPVANHETKTADTYPLRELVVDKPLGLYVMEEFDRPIVPSTQASAAKLIQRELGMAWLPEGWTIVLTGNGDSDGCADPDRHVINRCCCLYIDANGEQAQRDFINFAEHEGFDKSVLLMAQLTPMESFTDWRDVSEYTYRSAFYASGVIKAWRKFRGLCKNGGIDLDSVLLAVLCGLVGVVAGRELHALAVRDASLPSFGQVVNSPDTVEVCKEIDRATPYLDSLIRLCSTAHDAKQVLRYIVRHHAEVARCSLQKLVAHRITEVSDAVKNDSVYIKFITND